MNDNFKAIIAMILAVLCVTIMSVQAKLIGIEYHPVQIAFARAIVVLILLSPVIYKLGGFNFLKTKKPKTHFFRGIAGLIGNIMFPTRPAIPLKKCVFGFLVFRKLKPPNL